jgi:hypothetical protein
MTHQVVRFQNVHLHIELLVALAETTTTHKALDEQPGPGERFGREIQKQQ